MKKKFIKVGDKKFHEDVDGLWVCNFRTKNYNHRIEVNPGTFKSWFVTVSISKLRVNSNDEIVVGDLVSWHKFTINSKSDAKKSEVFREVLKQAYMRVGVSIYQEDVKAYMADPDIHYTKPTSFMELIFTYGIWSYDLKKNVKIHRKDEPREDALDYISLNQLIRDEEYNDICGDDWVCSWEEE